MCPINKGRYGLTVSILILLKSYRIVGCVKGLFFLYRIKYVYLLSKFFPLSPTHTRRRITQERTIIIICCLGYARYLLTRIAK